MNTKHLNYFINEIKNPPPQKKNEEKCILSQVSTILKIN